MTLEEFIQQVPGFHNMNHPEKIKLFGWFLHVHKNAERFKPADIRACYNERHIDPPANPNRFLDSLTEKKPKELLMWVPEILTTSFPEILAT